MAPHARYIGPTIDCPDPVLLGAFYTRLTDWKTAWEDEEWVSISPDGSQSGVISFQRVADYRAPDWPGQERPQQFHLDFYVDDLDDAVADALELGARLAGRQPDDPKYRVLLDPAGHPFCLAVESAE